MKLWKENRTDKEYEMPDEKIIEAFLASYYNRDVQNLDRSLTLFISSKDGLNSSFEPKDYSKLSDMVRKPGFFNKINFIN